DGSADGGLALRGSDEVFQGQLILRLGGYAVVPVAVQGVEGLASGGFGDGDDGLDIGLEFGFSSHPGDQAPVPRWHVACEEVQAIKLHAGVPKGSNEIV